MVERPQILCHGIQKLSDVDAEACYVSTIVWQRVSPWMSIQPIFAFSIKDLLDLHCLVSSNHKKHKLAVEFAKPVIHALQEKGIPKIGAVGFCLGGAKVVVELAKDADVQVAALLHPTFVTLDDIKGVKVPVAILGAEFDKISPPELVKQFEAALQAKPEVDHFVKIFPGVSHGWAVRYRDEAVTAVKSAQEAHQDIVDWFGKCLQTAHSAL
ncbi:hypothetical protein E3N88_41076 [Mikania micrantha]|uniref:Dienelactone hydrolase domain-containing protein n=1 Tax=Mikania micrantha TaxID=192012 RepID=A0A5N6LPI9_9ASTR|nr:hypothetical protein E3N88_41076 [Mikania micrantha]